MKRTILIICLLTSVCSLHAQQEIYWKQLAKVRWTKAYVTELDDYYDLPFFATEIKALDGKQIIIEGFSIPLEVGSKTFALSAQPSRMCFFCNGAGPESVMEVIVNQEDKSFDKVRTDWFIKIRGTLKLNRKDPDHLMYILENVELLQVNKRGPGSG
ncbi:MAG: hypothetical protein AB2L20_28045 [Mangrovibacterium sp.]